MTRTFQKAILVFASTIGVLLFSEIGLRTIYYQHTLRQNGHLLALQSTINSLSQKLNTIRSRVAIGGDKHLQEFSGEQALATMTKIPELDRYITEEHQIRSLFDQFRDYHIAFGNTPFCELITDRVQSIVKDENGYLVNRPRQTFKQSFLRSRIFENWDPIAMKQCGGNNISDSVRQFIERYSFAQVTINIDEFGDRKTVPTSKARETFLVVGDSVAFGVMLNDEDTIASQLQRRFPLIRFVNASVAGCSAADNRGRLTHKLAIPDTQVLGVIYVHCENDFNKKDTPETIIDGVSGQLEQAGVGYRALVYQQYIYRTMPDIFRDRPQSETERFSRFKAQTTQRAVTNRFDVVDFYQIVDQYRVASGTPLAGFSLYVDHCHFSALGTRMVVDQLECSIRSYLSTHASSLLAKTRLDAGFPRSNL